MKLKNKKIMKTTLLFNLFIALILVVSNVTNAQNNNGSKTINKSIEVPAGVTIQLNNYSGDLNIHSSENNAVHIKTKVEVTGNTAEDEKKLLESIDNFKFELYGNKLEIDTRFYKNMNTTNNRSIITLLNGDKVKVKDLKINHELQIPKKAELKLNNKYSDIEMQSIDGKADLTLYSSKLYAQDFKGNVNIESKYSKLWLGEIKGDVEIDFYDSEIEMKSCADMNIKTKYSKFEIEKADKLEVDSYNDKFEIDKLSGLIFTSKYSDFFSDANLDNLQLELYDCNITIHAAENTVVNSRYSDLKLGDVKYLKSDDSYDNNFYLGNTSVIEIGRCKYSQYQIEAAAKITMDDIYNGNINIGKLNNDFRGVDINGKYTKLEIDAGSVPFQVNFNIKYPKVDIPETVKITKQIKDNSNLELVGGDSGGMIKITGYDMKVVIDD